nr:RNA-directed DNA polymerase, eukaryota, reverse transcriptase zinc-binding domain protein [Tanacetum cinerariifolium]
RESHASHYDRVVPKRKYLRRAKSKCGRCASGWKLRWLVTRLKVRNGEDFSYIGYLMSLVYQSMAVKKTSFLEIESSDSIVVSIPDAIELYDAFDGVIETRLKENKVSKIGNVVFGNWQWCSNAHFSTNTCKILIGWNPNQERWARFIGYFANSYTNNIPWILMGDFNVTLKTSEHTAEGSCITRDMNDFNNCVNNLELEDIRSSGFQFTWTKSLKNPKSSIMKKLDRIIPVVVTIPEGLKMKKRSFRFIIFIADKEEFDDYTTTDYLNEYLVASNDELKLLQQKSKIKWLSESDQNTAYFHGILKSRKHKARIESICDEKGVIFNGDNVANAFVKNFKNFLRSKHDVHPLGSVKIKFDKVLSKKEAEDMIGLVSNEEISEAVFDIDSNKASGPDGYTSVFFKKAWHIVGKEVCLAIKDFFLNAKLLGEINATLIALIPKVDMPKKVSEFRPIACCNVIYKSIRKILTNRIKKGLQKVVNFNQSAFIPGRHTQDNILIAQELLKGGLRQGNPISPYLFTLVIKASVYMLPTTTIKEIEKLLKGPLSEFIPKRAWYMERYSDKYENVVDMINNGGFGQLTGLTKRLATQDRLARWNTQSNDVCPLCKKDKDSHEHMFFKCEFAKQIWEHLNDKLGFLRSNNELKNIVSFLSMSKAKKSLGKW